MCKSLLLYNSTQTSQKSGGLVHLTAIGLNTYTDVSSWAIGLMFNLSLHLHPDFVCLSNEGIF